MRALIYLLKTMIKNYFKKMKEKPQKAIVPVLIILYVAIVAYSSISSFTSGKGQVTDSDIQIFTNIVVVLTLAMVFFSIYVGTKKVKSRFEMCDANLLFVSPIKPQSVMLYGIVKQMHFEILGSAYILMQLPRVLKNFNISSSKQFVFLLAYIVFHIVFCNIIKLLSFSLNTKYKNYGFIARTTIKVIIIFSILGGAAYIFKTKSIEPLIRLAENITYSPIVKYIPIIGWTKEIATQTLTGTSLYCLIYIGLILLLSVLLIYVIYRMELDFYEDMLSSVEENEKKLKAGLFNKPFRKTKELKLKNVYGAKVLFFKHMNEYFKRSFIFFINTYSILVLASSILLGIFVKELDIKYILISTFGLLFFSSGLSSKIYHEISYDFIFLIPDKSVKKLFYSVSSSLVKISFDSLLIFIPFGVLSKASIFEIVFCIISYISLAGMLSCSGLLAHRITEALGLTESMTRILIVTLFQILIVIPMLIFGPITMRLSVYGFYAITLVYCLIIGTVSVILSSGMLNDMEFDKN